MEPNPTSGAAESIIFILLVIVASQVIGIIIYWLTSLLVARELATIKNAFLTWLQTFLSVLAVAVLATVGSITATSLGAVPTIPGVIVICAVISFLVVVIAVPMRIYDLGLGKGLLFFIITIVFNAAAGFISTPWTQDLAEDPAIQSMLKSTRLAPATASPVRTTVSLKERREALERRAEQLALRKQYAPKNDVAALRRYDADKAAYDRDLAALKADEAAAASNQAPVER
jgi:hypothetical protein